MGRSLGLSVPPCSQPQPWVQELGHLPRSRVRAYPELPLCSASGSRGDPWKERRALPAPRGWRRAAPLPQSPPAGVCGRGGPDHTAPCSGPVLGDGLLDETCSYLGQRHAGGARAAPKGHRPQEGKPWGLRPCSPSWSHRQGLAPGRPLSVLPLHCPVSPPLLPSPLLSRRCLVQQPWTEHVLAIQGEVPRARQQGTGGQWQRSELAALGWAVSSQAENLIYLVQKL